LNPGVVRRNVSSLLGCCFLLLRLLLLVVGGLLDLLGVVVRASGLDAVRLPVVVVL